MGERSVWKKKRAASERERPGENELVVCGFMEEDLGSSLFLIFWSGGCFCVRRGFAVSHRGVSKTRKHLGSGVVIW